MCYFFINVKRVLDSPPPYVRTLGRFEPVQESTYDWILLISFIILVPMAFCVARHT